MLPSRRPRATVAVSLIVISLMATACTGDSGGRTPPDTNGPDQSSTTSSDRRPGWVVSLGDSYIAGEGARWGANTSGPIRSVDALGPDAYFDHRGQESEPGCHRASRTVVIPSVAGLRGKNVACSGATTRSDSSGLRFTPGLDFAHETDGDGIGQALALARFAAHHRVGAIVVSVGGNDFGFGALAGGCVTGYLASVGGSPQVCSRDPGLRARFGPAGRDRVGAAVRAALDRVTVAMTHAGYADGDYRRILMTYPSPVPPGDRLRFDDGDRGARGGCPLFVADATWADRVALPAIDATVARAAHAARHRFEVLDLSSAFDGHRLCERGTSRLSETGLRTWRAPGASDRVEWVNQVYTTIAPHQVQESLHPNYWGTAAEHACLELVLSGPGRAAYHCRPDGPGLRHGDPVMVVTGDGASPGD